MSVSGFVFDTREEIDQFLEGMFKNSQNITLDEILFRADHKSFATQDLRDYFIQAGKNALEKAV